MEHPNYVDYIQYINCWFYIYVGSSSLPNWDVPRSTTSNIYITLYHFIILDNAQLSHHSEEKHSKLSVFIRSKKKDSGTVTQELSRKVEHFNLSE